MDIILLERIGSLGGIGDVVTVKAGYARNYLIPHGCATRPTERAKQALAERRAQVQDDLARLRKDMEATVEKLAEVEVTIERSCNDHGFLYASVTQKNIADALADAGFPQIHERHVRIGTAIKRIDSYMIPIQVDHDLKAEIKLWVVADRELVFEDDVRTEEGEREADGSPDSSDGKKKESAQATE